MAMSGKLEQLRRSTPDLAHLDPLSAEVRAWLDEAYAAVRRVDAVEGVILKLHEHSLRDPRFRPSPAPRSSRRSTAPAPPTS